MIIIGVDYHPELSTNCVFRSGNRGMRRTSIKPQRWRSRGVLSGPAAARNPRAGGDGGHRLLTLVRAGYWRTGYRGVDWRCGGDQETASREAETDRFDAQLLLKLLLENRFPRIWVPSPENRDLRQLLWHRHRLVQMRTRIMNQLQAVALNEGYRWKKKLFSERGRALLEETFVGSLGQSAPERIIGAAGPAGSPRLRS